MTLPVVIKTHTNGSGVDWKFSMLVRTPDSTRKYTPNPDFMLLPRSATNTPVKTRSVAGFCPILLGVVSNPKESDRWRLLLQLTVCARLNALLCTGSEPLIVQGIYLSKNFEVERFLAYADVRVSVDFVHCQASCHLFYGRMCTRSHHRSISVAIFSRSEPPMAPQIFFDPCTIFRN